MQRCFRTSDIENVGHTARHCTFFEMLGNFSFGDYFKEGAIRFAWEFSLDHLSSIRSVIWVSYFGGDDEIDAGRRGRRPLGGARRAPGAHRRAAPQRQLLGPGRAQRALRALLRAVLRPRAGIGCADPDCQPGCDCDRFVEYWNLVFTGYNMDEDGQLTPLPKQNIDTGMGLERIAALKQGVTSVFVTDLFSR